MLMRGFVILFMQLASDAAAKVDRPQRPLAGRQASRPPLVVCGTTILRADPRVEQRFLKPTPPGNFTLRTVRPTICRDALASRTDEPRMRLPYFLGPRR
jgi:hypothetical protein